MKLFLQKKTFLCKKTLCNSPAALVIHYLQPKYYLNLPILR